MTFSNNSSPGFFFSPAVKQSGGKWEQEFIISQCVPINLCTLLTYTDHVVE